MSKQNRPTMTDMAKRLGISRQTLHAIKRRTPKMFEWLWVGYVAEWEK